MTFEELMPRLSAAVRGDALSGRPQGGPRGCGGKTAGGVGGAGYCSRGHSGKWFDKITKCIWEKREYKLVKKLPKFTYHRLESKIER